MINNLIEKYPDLRVLINKTKEQIKKDKWIEETDNSIKIFDLLKITEESGLIRTQSNMRGRDGGVDHKFSFSASLIKSDWLASEMISYIRKVFFVVSDDDSLSKKITITEAKRIIIYLANTFTQYRLKDLSNIIYGIIWKKFIDRELATRLISLMGHGVTFSEYNVMNLFKEEIDNYINSSHKSLLPLYFELLSFYLTRSCSERANKSVEEVKRSIEERQKYSERESLIYFLQENIYSITLMCNKDLISERLDKIAFYYKPRVVNRIKIRDLVDVNPANSLVYLIDKEVVDYRDIKYTALIRSQYLNHNILDTSLRDSLIPLYIKSVKPIKRGIKKTVMEEISVLNNLVSVIDEVLLSEEENGFYFIKLNRAVSNYVESRVEKAVIKSEEKTKYKDSIYESIEKIKEGKERWNQSYPF